MDHTRERTTDHQASPFTHMLRQAGLGFFLLEFIAKLPLAMTLVGVLTMITDHRQSIAEAGIVSGVLGLASGIFAPLIGLAADRWGQRIVLIPISIVNGLALIGITAAVYSDAPLWALFLISVLVGVSSPQIGPMGRARWIGMMAAKAPARGLNAAMSWESMTDEVGFIVGPILVAALTSLINPAAPVIVGAVIVLTFAVGFGIHPTHTFAARTSTTNATRQASALSRPIVIAALGMLGIGLFWGVTLTTVTELADTAGAPGTGGFIYGAMGVTASATALATGALPERITLTTRWIVAALLATICAIPLLFTTDPLWAGVWYFLIGAGVGPVLVTIFTLAAQVAPAGRQTTVMTLVGSGNVIGQALGTSFNGFVLENTNAQVGFANALALLAVMTLTGCSYRALVRTPEERTSQFHQHRGNREG